MSYRLTIPDLIVFLGAFLLFGIQPMTGKALLPIFGGTAGVWVVCLVTFQLLLPAGYFYAHCLAMKITPTRCFFHGGFVLFTAGITAFAPRFLAGTFPLFRMWGELGVLLAVLALAGSGFLLLSANSPLVQAILQRPESNTRTTRVDVYRLYAVSNFGSLLGLLAYPFVFEPFVEIGRLWILMGTGLAVYGILFMWWARHVVKGSPGLFTNEETAEKKATLPWKDLFKWLLLPAISSALLNSVTAHLSSDISPVPLLWVILLLAFLSSYIIGFSGFGEKNKSVFSGITLIMLIGCVTSFGIKAGEGFRANLLSGLGLVLFGSIFLHSWLYSLRPNGCFLTRYYLCIAVGGAVGGVLSGLVAPFLFDSILEYPMVICFVAILCASYVVRERFFAQNNVMYRVVWLSYSACCLGGMVLFLLLNGFVGRETKVVYASRNFYGCLRVEKITAISPLGIENQGFALYHGETMHGLQFGAHYLKKQPTAYYGALGGGLAVTSHPRYTDGGSMRVGVVGLGVGTMACWGRTNDVCRFYEINPEVIRIACNTNYFTYISDSVAKIELVPGDARQTLEQESKKGDPLYDVLVIDAYSGDSIPYHLATREAFELYFSRLKSDGILALHVSNWHLDLGPLCKAAAKRKGFPIYGVSSPEKDFCKAASWVLITRQDVQVGAFEVKMTDWTQVRDMVLPTDEKGSLLPLLRYGFSPPAKKVEFKF